ncbi:MAG: flagellin [Polyangiaceae bacterium]
MALFIQTNVASLFAQKNLASIQTAQAGNFRRLSSGLRINSAADDPAGLGISQRLGAQIACLSVAERNANDAISMAQTGESALGQMSTMLIRMRELSVQGANGELTAVDRGFLDTEFSSLRDEITRISVSTKFNGKDLLAGAAAVTTFQVGIENTAADHIDITFGGVDTTALGINTTTLAGATAAASQAAIDAIDTAIGVVSTRRADFGASMNRIGETVANMQSMRTNMTAANSRIRDVDVADETAILSRNQVLSQAAVAVLTQSNQTPQLALSLLRG